MRLIRKRYPEVWLAEVECESVVVFYMKDADIKLNDENGINAQIKTDYYNLLKRYDRFAGS